MIRFSVIIPVFRVENYLRQCVDSVLNQTFNNFEIILVDDGSPDNSPAICDEYVQKDKRVHVIHKINGGLSSARNAGLTVAQGEYVLFLDSDDWWDDLEALAKIDIKLKGANTDILIIGLKKFFMQQNKISNIRVPKIQSEEKSHEPFDVQIKKYMQNNNFVA